MYPVRIGVTTVVHLPQWQRVQPSDLELVRAPGDDVDDDDDDDDVDGDHNHDDSGDNDENGDDDARRTSLLRMVWTLSSGRVDVLQDKR